MECGGRHRPRRRRDRWRSVALASCGLDSLIEIAASTVVLWELSGTGEQRQRTALRLMLFTACGAWMSRASAGRPGRLLVWVFVIASVTTAVLSLDAAVVLLTPAVFATAAPEQTAPRMPVFTLAVVALTLAGFAFASAAGINPAWVAATGALVLAARAVREKRTTVTQLVTAASPMFLAFVLALGIVVRAVVDHGLAGALGHKAIVRWAAIRKMTRRAAHHTT